MKQRLRKHKNMEKEAKQNKHVKAETKQINKIRVFEQVHAHA